MRSPGPWRAAIVPLAVLAACIFQLGAERVRVSPLDGVDVSGVTFVDDGFVFPNGSKVEFKLDDKGKVKFATGETVDAWNGLKPEASLAADAFTCHEGRLFAIRVPAAKAPGKKKHKKRTAKAGKFHYLRRTYRPQWGDCELYHDVAQDTRHFLIFPPTDDLGPKWHVLMRRSRSHSIDGWIEERLFDIDGRRHPCNDKHPLNDVLGQAGGGGDAAEEPVPETARTQVGSGVARAAAAIGPEAGPPKSAGGAGADRGSGGGGDEGGDEGDIFAARTKPGPLAEDTVRGLLSKLWKPGDWRPSVQFQAPIA